ncbi:MAG: 6-phosphogluconolactonase [Holophagales bacterium]|nr:6-phosphogluconolactonase [Holophagales bacterium]
MTADFSPPDPEANPSVLEARFGQRSELAEALAESVAEDLRKAIDARGKACLVVSGGTTPVPLFEGLSHQLLPWEKVSVTLADERWVTADHPASNEGLVRRHLLVEEAAEARFTGLVTEHGDPAEGEDACEARLRSLPRPFDVVVLGMGTDGHTASLFPGAPELGRGLDLDSDRSCLAIHPPGAEHPRMSLTLRALLGSRRCIVHITGAEKWKVYRRALRPGPAEELPIRAVLGKGREPIDVYWAP